MKDFSSNVEDSRLETEEYIINKVQRPFITPNQIWRDADLILNCELNEDPLIELRVNKKMFKYKCCFSTIRNDINIDILNYYEKMPLFKISGTENAYNCQDFLKDIISPYFGKRFIYTLYIGSQQLPFGRGNPKFDIESGIVKILDKDINKQINNNLYITFYKYVGRKSFDNIENIPFSDKLIHFKQSEDNQNTASFLVRGRNHTNYILADDKYYDNSNIDNSRVVVTQESIENVINHGIVIDGGKW